MFYKTGLGCSTVGGGATSESTNTQLKPLGGLDSI